MTKRQAIKADRDPNGWYVETPACVNQVADAIDFGDDLIWDPACGGGNILDVMAGRGHPCVGSDIVERPRWGRQPFRFFRGNFLKSRSWPTPHDRKLSIFSNPPYNEPEPQIAERFMLHAIENVPFHRAAFIVPIEFACGQGRYERLYSRRPPSHVGFFMERPSMPPGQVLLDQGESARGGGMADYIVVVWTADWPYRTQCVFLAPSSAPAPRSERRVRRGSLAPDRRLTKGA